MNEKVLIVEDDLDLGLLLKQYLELNAFQVTLAGNGQHGRACLQAETFDMVLCDVMMPVEDGFTFAEQIKRLFPDLPFLFLTARKLKEDIIRGLKIGADDYITKPFDADELVLRVRNILKRSALYRQNAPVYPIGSYDFYPDQLLLKWPDGQLTMTEREAVLLKRLCDHKNKLVRKRDILMTIWQQDDFFTARSLDVFVSRLRKYLANDQRIRIESIRSAGIRLIVEA